MAAMALLTSRQRARERALVGTRERSRAAGLGGGAVASGAGAIAGQETRRSLQRTAGWQSTHPLLSAERRGSARRRRRSRRVRAVSVATTFSRKYVHVQRTHNGVLTSTLVRQPRWELYLRARSGTWPAKARRSAPGERNACSAPSLHLLRLHEPRLFTERLQLTNNALFSRHAAHSEPRVVLQADPGLESAIIE